ncbi:hypothetical protein ABPG72_014574 [Tetrahymena utriculariae]
MNGCRLCNAGTCIQCLDGFYMNSFKQCQSCSDIFGQTVATCNYDKISNSYNIVSCISGYYFNKNIQKCSPCGSFCQQCTDSYTCTQCQNGYFVFLYQCQLCQANNSIQGCCQQDFSNCITCNQSYYKGLNNQCKKCIHNCLSCQSGNQCDQCIDGYFYDQNQNQCVQNLLNCQQACITTNQVSNQLKCVNCVSDLAHNNLLYPNTNGICQACSLLNCSICSNQYQCQQCIQGYTLMQYQLNGNTYQQCYKCQTNCSRCQMQGNIKICYQCANGTQPVNGQCLQQLTFTWNVVQQQSGQILMTFFAIILILLI